MWKPSASSIAIVPALVLISACVDAPPPGDAMDELRRQLPDRIDAWQAEGDAVCYDPQTIYEVQGDSGTWVADNIGLNTTITTTAGSTTTGQSAAVLAQASVETTATLDVQIIDLKPEVGNELGAYAKFLVKLNNHQYVDGTTGIA